MKKKLFILIPVIFYSTMLMAQSVGINNTSPDASSILDIKSNDKGLLIPRMTMASISTISNPAKGLLVFDTAANQLMVNMGTAAVPNWQTIVAKSGWNLTGNSNTNTATHFIGTTDVKPLLFRVNNLPAGVIHPTSYNVGLGLGALSVNTTGNNNTAIGGNALLSNTIGIWNAAAGTNALLFNNTGNYNSAYGGNAMAGNTSGTENVAIGYASLQSNETGSFNTAIGKDAMYSNSTGTDNTAAGQGAMFANTTGYQNAAFGRNALHENTGGMINTAFGYNALYSNTTGQANSATGPFALTNNTTGIDNTAYGFVALEYNTTGSQNTATGVASLESNVTGDYNTAYGYSALSSSTVASNNTAIGAQSLWENTVGFNNTAIGDHSLSSNTIGNLNTAIGNTALSSTISGAGNTAIGANALNQNTNGDFNISIGAYSQPNLQQGADNIAMGYHAGFCNGFTNLTNSIVIGSYTCTQNTNFALFGTPTTLWNGGNLTWSTYSDARIKRNIKEDVAGLSFIMKLRPVTYNRSVKDMSQITGIEPREYAEKYDIEKIRFTGFIAQDVEKAANEINYDFSGITKPKSSTDLYSLSYESFVVPLVKAVQELSAKSDTQQAIIEEQNRKIELLLKEIQSIKEKIK